MTQQTAPTGPLVDWQPGVAYPVKAVAKLADGTTYTAHDWVIIWDYTPTAADTAKAVITTAKEDTRTPGRILPGSEPHQVTIQTGTPITIGSLTLHMDYDENREIRYYTATDEAANSPEIMRDQMLKRIAQLAAYDDYSKLSVAEVAEYLGIKPSSFRSRVSRGAAPDPDGYHDARTPYWLRSTIASTQGKK